MDSQNTNQISASGASDVAPPKRRWQFSLYSILVLLTLSAILLGLGKTLLAVWPEGAVWLLALAGLTIFLLVFLVVPLILSYMGLLWLAGALMDWLDRTTVTRPRIRLGPGLPRK